MSNKSVAGQRRGALMVRKRRPALAPAAGDVLLVLQGDTRRVPARVEHVYRRGIYVVRTASGQRLRIDPKGWAIGLDEIRAVLPTPDEQAEIVAFLEQSREPS